MFMNEMEFLIASIPYSSIILPIDTFKKTDDNDVTSVMSITALPLSRTCDFRASYKQAPASVAPFEVDIIWLSMILHMAGYFMSPIE